MLSSKESLRLTIETASYADQNWILQTKTILYIWYVIISGWLGKMSIHWPRPNQNCLKFKRNGAKYIKSQSGNNWRLKSKLQWINNEIYTLATIVFLPFRVKIILFSYLISNQIQTFFISNSRNFSKKIIPWYRIIAICLSTKVTKV